ncbi:hypothetical protein [Paenibacillus wynnii]|nr:hypothetical protein [Paenibacillus wynnii]
MRSGYIGVPISSLEPMFHRDKVCDDLCLWVVSVKELLISQMF